jgi:hypothetical protein
MENLMNRVSPNTMTRDIVSWARTELEAGRPARFGRWVAYPSGALYRGNDASRNTPDVTGQVHMGSAAPAGALADSLVSHWLADWS